MTDDPKRPRGRPPKPIPKLDATPEKVAQALFAAATPPDPSPRKRETAAPKQADGQSGA